MDVISEAMETFIDKFKAELVPASVEIVGRLVSVYHLGSCLLSDVSFVT